MESHENAGILILMSEWDPVFGVGSKHVGNIRNPSFLFAILPMSLIRNFRI